jgi:hypothetical protein
MKRTRGNWPRMTFLYGFSSKLTKHETAACQWTGLSKGRILVDREGADWSWLFSSHTRGWLWYCDQAGLTFSFPLDVVEPMAPGMLHRTLLADVPSQYPL